MAAGKRGAANLQIPFKGFFLQTCSLGLLRVINPLKFRRFQIQFLLEFDNGHHYPVLYG